MGGIVIDEIEENNKPDCIIVKDITKVTRKIK